MESNIKVQIKADVKPKFEADIKIKIEPVEEFMEIIKGGLISESFFHFCSNLRKCVTILWQFCSKSLKKYGRTSHTQK